MEGERISKRRKIDDGSTSAPHGNATPQRSRKSIEYVDKTPGYQLPANSVSVTLSGRVKRLSNAHPGWSTTEASGQAIKQQSEDKKASVNHGINDMHPSPAKTPSTARKAKLDPLRNQKAAPNSPARAASTVGFFKQFHTPKKGIEVLKAALAQDTQQPESRHDTPLDTPNANTLANEEVRPPGTTPEDEESTAVRTSGRARRRPKRYDDDAAEPEAGGLGESRRKPRKLESGVKEVEKAVRQVTPQRYDHNASSEYHDHSVGGHSAPEVPSASESMAPGSNTTTTLGRRKQGKAAPNRSGGEKPYQIKELLDMVNVPRDTSPFTDQALPREENGCGSRAIHTLDSKNDPAAFAAGGTAIVEQKEQETQLLTSIELGAIQRAVLEQLTGRHPTRLAGLSDEYAKVSTLVKQTVSVGESNSMLLIGARGSGKTALVDLVLREQATNHPDDFYVVRLNGFIHTDDKIALREIWRQLGREMELDSDESMIKNYADTLTTLLALLSHPAEHGQQMPEHITKSVIFVLDEFELFAHHPRQTLLYNLFDIAQSRKAPIAVLGLTTKIDVSESLEKRVKSRFSHRYVHLGLPKSFSAYQEACEAVMKLQPSPTTPESVTASWNLVVDTLMQNHTFESILRRIYHTTKSVPEFMSGMLYSMATLSIDNDSDSQSIIEHISSTLSSATFCSPDSKLDILSSLSTLQTALLICAARLTAIYNADTVSFALAYEEYKILASKAKLQATASGSLATGAGARVSSKDVARDAWNALMECGFVIDDGRTGNGGRVDVGLEEIGMSGVDLGQWARWCKEI